MVHSVTKPSDLLRQAIQDALAESKMGARRFEVEHGLHKWALRGLLDPLRRQAPSVDRAKEICTALGLEFYIGPPREEDEISRVINRHIDDVMSPERELVYEFRAFRKEIVEALATLSRDRSADLRSGGLVENLVSSEHGSEQPEESAVVRFPAWRQVDQIDLAVAAGGGAEADDESVTERLTFRLDWLKSHGLDPAQCTVVKVQGESMEPALPEGSAILVDRARRRRREGGIFVVRTADGVVVKRLGKDDAGGWQLLSDHPAWDPVPWPQDAKVIGEVKWMARTL